MERLAYATLSKPDFRMALVGPTPVSEGLQAVAFVRRQNGPFIAIALVPVVH